MYIIYVVIGLYVFCSDEFVLTCCSLVTFVVFQILFCCCNVFQTYIILYVSCLILFGYFIYVQSNIAISDFSFSNIVAFLSFHNNIHKYLFRQNVFTSLVIQLCDIFIQYLSQSIIVFDIALDE